MKKLAFILTCVLYSVQFLNAQEETSNKELKIYYNFYESNLFIDLESMYRVGDISLSLEINRGTNWSHEFELMPFHLTRSKYIDLRPINGYEEILSGDKQSIYSSRFAYHLNYSVFNKNNFEFFVGFSTQLYFERQDVDPLTSLSFPKSYTRTGVDLGFTPGIIVPLSEKFYLTGSVPIGLFGVEYARSNMEDPTIPSNEQKNSDISAEFAYQGFQAKIGVGFKF